MIPHIGLLSTLAIEALLKCKSKVNRKHRRLLAMSARTSQLKYHAAVHACGTCTPTWPGTLNVLRGRASDLRSWRPAHFHATAARAAMCQIARPGCSSSPGVGCRIRTEPVSDLNPNSRRPIRSESKPAVAGTDPNPNPECRNRSESEPRVPKPIRTRAREKIESEPQTRVCQRFVPLNPDLAQ